MGVQCLLTVEGGFVHAQIISGVSVPLGLWKPSLATINRSAGRVLRLAGGRPGQQRLLAHLVCPQHVCV